MKTKKKNKKQHFRPNKEQIRKLLRPLSIAIIGATDTEGKTGTVITDNILSNKYTGNVSCVNPNHKEVFGQKCYATLADISHGVDCAIIVVPANIVKKVITESIGHCRNFVVISAGFSESGNDGVKRQNELQELADKEKLAILGPNCLGFITADNSINATFAQKEIISGNIALLSQSGALAVALIDKAQTTNQGFSFVISLGNKMQIDESLLLEFLADDDGTDAIAMYLEDITNGKRFIKIVEKIAHKKPVILLKGGKTNIGQETVTSHTGALVQSYDVLSSVCEKYGVILVESMNELVTTIAFVRRYKQKIAKNIAIITNAGGLGVLTVDALADVEMPLAKITKETQIKLEKILPEASSVVNPIDILGDAMIDRYEKVFEAVVNDKNVDSIMSIITPQSQTPVMAIAKNIVTQSQKISKPSIVSFVGGTKVSDAQNFVMRNNIPHARMPESLAMAIAKIDKASMSVYGKSKKRDIKNNTEGIQMIARIEDEGRTALYYAEAEKICKKYAIPVIKAWRMDYDSPSMVTFPCVAKIDAPHILHKTDKKGVIVNIDNGIDLNSAIEKLSITFPGERIIVQPMMPEGMQIILGMTRDETFGPVVMIGYGGIYTEQIDMTISLIPPFSINDVISNLKESRLSFLFDETRGIPKYSEKDVASIAVAISDMALEMEWMKTIEINPLFIYNNGIKPAVVDIKITTV